MILPAKGKGGGKKVGWALSDPWGQAEELGDPFDPNDEAWQDEESGGGACSGKAVVKGKGGGKKGGAWAVSDPWGEAEEEPAGYGGGAFTGKGAPRPSVAPSAAGGKGLAAGKARASIPGKGLAFGGGAPAAGKGGAFGCGAPAAGKGLAFGGGKGGAYGPPAGALASAKGAAGAKGAAWGAGGGGKGKAPSAADMKPASEGMLYEAIGEVVQSLAELEKEWDASTLEKKLRGYFNKGAKHMEFKGDLTALINKYADNVMASIFAGVGDRDWLYSGQVDFLLILDAGIKDTFPNYLMRGVKQEVFEQIVLAAYERAFDEQRFFPLLSEAVPAYVSGPKTKKKVWNAVDQARKDTMSQGIDNAQDFATAWITAAIGLVDDASQGNLEGCLTSAEMAQLFTALLEQGALPAVLTQDAEAPVGIVQDVVSAAYAENCGEAGQPAAKKIRGSLANWDVPDYGGKGAAFYGGAAAGA